MTPGLGMRVISGMKGLECTNCAMDPRFKQKFEYLVEVAIVRCGVAVHTISLCHRCIQFACKLFNEVRPKPCWQEEADGGNGA